MFCLRHPAADSFFKRNKKPDLERRQNCWAFFSDCTMMGHKAVKAKKRQKFIIQNNLSTPVLFKKKFKLNLQGKYTFTTNDIGTLSKRSYKK